MRQVCILTDDTAQFPDFSFPGFDRVNVIPLHIEIDGQRFPRGEGLRTQDLPVSIGPGARPTVHPPEAEEFQQVFLSLSRQYDEIVVILLSSWLAPALPPAKEAAMLVGGRVAVHLVDSQTTAVGLGLLVQAAAQAAQNGFEGVEIKRLIMGLIPHVYSAFYISGLSYLHHAGLLGPAQAIVGEMQEMLPMFVMESGRLTPVRKARNPRHVVDSLQEFVCEFPRLHHIAVVQGVPAFESEVRSLRERIGEDYPAISLSEHTISAPLATLVGPRSLGLFVMEKT